MLSEAMADLRAPGTLLFDTARPDAENRRSLLFSSPERVLRARERHEVIPCLEAAEAAIEAGSHVAGFLSYEAGYALASGGTWPAEHKRAKTPLVWLGAYEAPAVLDSPGVEALLASTASGGAEIRDASFRVAKADYLARLRTIKGLIREGEVYQINFAGPVTFTTEGDPVALYRRLRRRQRVAYGAFLNTGTQYILSLSPELFFRREGARIVTRPMKGTVRRGCTLEEDEGLQRWLAADEKSRAENLMIVDLLRNDLSIICRPGSVRVPRLFEVEPYETVNQMTSTVEGCLREGIRYADLFRALFPCGSVTGAPKLRAMEHIARLEAGTRGVYCGAIGYMAPGKQAAFSVAIRTAVLEEGKGRIGTGSGIVWDSDPEAEYEECLLKMRFLTAPHSEQVPEAETPFKLIESLHGEGERLWQVDRHVARMRQSAKYFGMPFDEERLRAELTERARALPEQERSKVRVTLDRAGRFEITKQAVEAPGEAPWRATFAAARVDPEDPLFYHKTTYRRVYERTYATAKSAGFDEALLLNTRGEVTEGTRTNVFIQQGDAYYTPPVASGLLDGVYRAHVLETNSRAEERVLYPEDVLEAEAVYLCNAVRGWRRVVVAAESLAGAAPGRR